MVRAQRPHWARHPSSRKAAAGVQGQPSLPAAQERTASADRTLQEQTIIATQALGHVHPRKAVCRSVPRGRGMRTGKAGRSRPGPRRCCASRARRHRDPGGERESCRPSPRRRSWWKAARGSTWKPFFAWVGSSCAFLTARALIRIKRYVDPDRTARRHVRGNDRIVPGGVNRHAWMVAVHPASSGTGRTAVGERDAPYQPVVACRDRSQVDGRRAPSLRGHEDGDGVEEVFGLAVEEAAGQLAGGDATLSLLGQDGLRFRRAERGGVAVHAEDVPAFWKRSGRWPGPPARR